MTEGKGSDMQERQVTEARELLSRWVEASGDAGSNDAENEVGTDMADFIRRLFGWRDIENVPEERELPGPPPGSTDGPVKDRAFDVEITGVIRVKGMTEGAAWDRVREIDCYSADVHLGPDLKVMLTEISVDPHEIELFED